MLNRERRVIKSDPGLGPFYLWTFFFTSEPNVSCGGEAGVGGLVGGGVQQHPVI